MTQSTACYMQPMSKIFLQRKVPEPIEQHRLALNTNALTLWARSPKNGSLDSGIQAWYLSARHMANSGELLYT
jgi:hypothetical protein